jgi:hypothetical protein
VATGGTAGCRFPAGASFPPLHSIQTGSGANPGSYPMGTGGALLGVKHPGRKAELSSCAEVKNSGAIPPLPHMSSWRGV